MQLQFILATLVVSVASEQVTFKNVTVRCQNFNDGYDSTIEIESAASLNVKLPEKSITKVTVVGQVPVLYEGAITDLSYIKDLQLKLLEIEEIHPGAFKLLPALDTLNLNENRIRRIQEGVFSGLNVRFLHLDQNLIEEIEPRAFDDLPKLLHLSLEKNKLREFNPQWLDNKPTLGGVNLIHNEIKKVPPGSFSTYHNDIYFNNNRISTLSPSMFGSGKKSIGQLWISDNNIEELDESVFKDAEVRALDISNNKLQCLVGKLDNFFVAYQTAIDGNPWNCTCVLKMGEWALKSKLHGIDMTHTLQKCNLTAQFYSLI